MRSIALADAWSSGRNNFNLIRLFAAWLVIYGLTFPRSSRMARLELPEFEYVPLWAIQSGDGQRIRRPARRHRRRDQP